TGDTNEWRLSNTQWAASVDLGTHPGNYQISGTGDFNGDGIDDVLWTSASSSGVQTDIWELNANGQWMASVSPGTHPAGYTVAGVGDWTGSGTDGILWYNSSTGDTDEWQLSNGQWAASVDLGAHPGSGWQIAGVGDFFGNGIDDVLWTNSSNGRVQTDIWELNSNGQWMASVSPGTHPAGYQVVGVGDFTGSGTDDILWYNPTTGDVDEWLIANGKWAGSVDLGIHPGDFQIAGVGDFTGTGTDGILWYSPTAATIGTGATLELAAADSASVTFGGSTGTLILDEPSTFSGEIFNFTGNGSLTGSDQIDLKGINYNSVHDSYANGVLTVTDGTNTVKLDFNGSYTLANFDFASDGSGGTIVYDPPVPTSNALAPTTSSGQTITACEPQTGGSATIGTGATLELGAGCSEAVTFGGATGTLI